MSTADWGQTLPLGDGVIGDARPFQARLRSALAQALKVGPQKVKWNAVVGLLEVKAKGEKHPQVYTGMGVILSRSICLNISEDAPWICHCCHCEVSEVRPGIISMSPTSSLASHCRSSWQGRTWTKLKWRFGSR